MTVSKQILLILIIGLVSHVKAFTYNDYHDALDKTLRFYDVQRSGKLPSWQRVPWRGDSALKDGSLNNVDLAGGYYDAGDNIKFGFPMAYTISLLSWSVVEFGDELRRLGQLTHALNAISWGTDYLLKAHTHPTELYVQVGDPTSDHNCWERPEDMDTPRTTSKIDANNPGSDVAGETAAALAAASIAFQSIDNGYSQLLLTHAQQIFEFANTYRGKYSDHLSSQVCPYYCSYNGYEDELAWAATWLFKATKDPKYQQYLLNDMNNNISNMQSDAFDWDNKMIGVQVLIAKDGDFNSDNFKAAKNQADAYICKLLPKNIISNSNTQFTPGGLQFHSENVNMEYVTSNALLLAIYTKHSYMSSRPLTCGSSIQVQSSALLSAAKKQVDYILGDNPSRTSYMVGFGYKYPQFIHHRASTLPSMASYSGKIDCQSSQSYFASTSPNVNVAVGAIVGGPDANDNFQDSRRNNQQGEPTTYTNAPFVGVLAHIADSVSH